MVSLVFCQEDYHFNNVEKSSQWWRLFKFRRRKANTRWCRNPDMVKEAQKVKESFTIRKIIS